MRETKSRLIGNTNYEVTQLGAIEGSKVFARFIKLLAPAIASKDFSRLFEGITDDDIDYLFSAFGPCTMAGGIQLKKADLDLHFAGKYEEMFSWLAFCLEVNFTDFWSALAPKVDAAARAVKAQSISSSPSTSTGASGVSSPASTSTSP